MSSWLLFSHQVDQELKNMSETQREHDAEPGDLIKIICKGYQHWVVYIGGDEVVGLPGPKNEYSDGALVNLINGEAEVTRENIWDVVGNDKFKVHNPWDGIYKPLKEEDIVTEACEREGQKLKYCWSTYNSEHFAKELRYGKQDSLLPLQLKAQAPEVPLSRVHDAKPGDLIEIFRSWYQHWVVYIGNDEVVGLTSPGGDGVIYNMLHGEAEVLCENIWHVIGKDEFRVNNLWDEKYEPREVELILKETKKSVGKKLRYSLFSHNCEHFASEQRYGKAESWQVKRAGWIAAIITSLSGFIFWFMLKPKKMIAAPPKKKKKNCPDEQKNRI